MLRTLIIMVDCQPLCYYKVNSDLPVFIEKELVSFRTNRISSSTTIQLRSHCAATSVVHKTKNQRPRPRPGGPRPRPSWSRPRPRPGVVSCLDRDVCLKF